MAKGSTHGGANSGASGASRHPFIGKERERDDAPRSGRRSDVGGAVQRRGASAEMATSVPHARQKARGCEDTFARKYLEFPVILHGSICGKLWVAELFVEL